MYQFIGEIRIFSQNLNSYEWLPCDGRTINIYSAVVLYSIIGTTYGGDGRSTFGLPNFNGAAPMQAGQGPGLSNRYFNVRGGVSTVALTIPQIPAHNHLTTASGESADPPRSSPINNTWGERPDRESLYNPSPGNHFMNSAAIIPAGGNQPHNNMQPYLALNFYIAKEGIIPSRPQ